MGFASPPRRHLFTRVHSHQNRNPGFGLRLPHRKSRSALVVSHHPDGFLREQAVSLLRLTAGLRFAAFPLRSPQSTDRSRLNGHRRDSPQRVSHPSKDSPRQQPHRVTTAVAFLTFHSLAASVAPPKSRAEYLVITSSEELIRPTRQAGRGSVRTGSDSEEPFAAASSLGPKNQRHGLTSLHREEEGVWTSGAPSPRGRPSAQIAPRLRRAVPLSAEPE